MEAPPRSPAAPAATIGPPTRTQGATLTHTRFQKAEDWSFANARVLGYAPGTQVDWLIRALRTGLADPHYAGFFPTRYAHANNDPNAVAAAYPFYVSTTQ